MVDNGKSDVCHGWALKAAAAGTMVTIVNRCRMWINTTFTIGVRVYTGAVSGGSAPTTSGGVVVGFAWKADEVYLRAPTPAADG